MRRLLAGIDRLVLYVFITLTYTNIRMEPYFISETSIDPIWNIFWGTLIHIITNKLFPLTESNKASIFGLLLKKKTYTDDLK